MEGNIKLGGEISLRRTKRCANKRRKYQLGRLNCGMHGRGEEGGDSSCEARMAWGIVSPTLDAKVHYEGGRLSSSTNWQGG